MMQKHLLLVLLGLMGLGLYAQPGAEAQLAEQYFADAEFESALELYEKLYKNQPEEQYGLRIAACYEALNQYEEALKFLDKSIRKQPRIVIFPVLKAMILEKTGAFKEAEKLYKEIIDKKLLIEADFVRVGSYLYQQGRLELALQTYLKGRKRMKDPYIFSSEIANIYVQMGEFEAATQEYLNKYYGNPSNLSSVNLDILNMVNADSQEEVERALLSAVDKHPSDLGIRSILYEYYVLSENFYEAFIQVKSIDRLFREDGARVYYFGQTMRNNKEYELSNSAFDYIIDRHKNSAYYYQAFIEKAVNGELRAFEQLPVNLAAVRQAVDAYSDLLDKFGRKPAYFNAIYRRDNLMVFYLFELDEALAELQNIVRQPLLPEQWAKAKLLIGDILLMQKDYNQAKLTYTEVSERFHDSPTGALAKYKLGQLAYYKGEFQLAQALLSAIKDNTHNDISNDAIKLNLAIIDNTGLDTTTTALEIFAQAQLLAYQRNFDEALALMDSVAYNFPNHTLADDILWEKAQIALKRDDIPLALEYIDRILQVFPTDIYGDDALYTKARIYDYNREKHQEAMQFYLQFLTTYPGSLYSVEVRKRIRELRKEG
ncbi:MAG: hypothetical protein D6730_19345 [Bacteroidetes bacterium]|nr:MAG: hypothetical protein D6730_19345 [Bacteroidota bacterium]